MKLIDLETKLAERADAVVQEKIKVFKKEIDDALKKLFGFSSVGGDSFGQYGFFEGTKEPYWAIPRMKLAALKLAIWDRQTKGESKVKLPWPSQLWDKERESLRDELLAKMDLMQQLLISKPRSSENDVPYEGETGA
jgi:hypothetical protein